MRSVILTLLDTQWLAIDPPSCDTTNHHQTINTKGKLETWGWRDT